MTVGLNATRAAWGDRFGTRDPKIVCVGLNYRHHAAEQAAEAPTAPLLFAKFANTLCGDGDSILLPPAIGHVDAEAELAVVIGERAQRIEVEDALRVVAGYTCANDVSAREAQFADGQWFRAKGYDGFCPIGPEVVPVDELGDASGLTIRQRLNGELLQEANTSELIFAIPALVAYVSAVLTLERGDIILTGTPAGVGFFREPKVGLGAGDLVEVEIERIGVLRNRVEIVDLAAV